MKRQSGFTLIELVMVIVILGVLAAVAIPKFVSLKGDAQVASLKGVVGGINSASTVNFAVESASPGKGFKTAGLPCDAAVVGILQGSVPAGYTLKTSENISSIPGTSSTCTVEQTDGKATLLAEVIAI